MIIFLFIIILSLIPDFNWACSSCSQGLNEAYLWGVLLLMLLPLLLLGFIIFYFKRQHKKFNSKN